MIHYLLVGGLVIMVSTVMSKFSQRYNIPSLLLFVGLGMVLGVNGIFHIEFSNYQISQDIATFCLIFIMFYGGFGISWAKAKPIALQAGLLSSLGIVLTTFFMGVFAHFVLGFTWLEAFLMGAVMSSTDAASVFNILRMRQLNLKGGIASLLEMESGSNDPFAYMLTIIILGLMSGSDQSIGLLLISQLAFGAGFGLLVGRLGVWMIQHIQFKESSIKAIFVAMIAILAFAIPTLLQGNGFLSAYMAGVLIGNAQLKHKKDLVLFFDAITQMMQIILFFMLGLLSDPMDMPRVFLPALAIFAFLTLVSRPLSVWLTLKPFKEAWNVVGFLSVGGLRGAASIVFAMMTVVSSAHLDHDIFHIVYIVALLSIIIQGSSLTWAAHTFDVIDEDNDVRLTFNDYIDQMPIELTSFQVDEESHWVNQDIKDIHFPSPSLVVGINREDHFFLPQGGTQVQAGDQLILSSPSYRGDDLYLDEVLVGEDHPWKNLKLFQIETKDVLLIAMIKRKDRILIPDGNTQILENDTLVLCKLEDKLI